MKTFALTNLISFTFLLGSTAFADSIIGVNPPCGVTKNAAEISCQFENGATLKLSFQGKGKTCSGPFPEGGRYRVDGSHRNGYLDVEVSSNTGASNRVDEKSLKFYPALIVPSSGVYCSDWDTSDYHPQHPGRIECPEYADYLKVEEIKSRHLKKHSVVVKDVHGSYGKPGEAAVCSSKFKLLD